MLPLILQICRKLISGSILGVVFLTPVFFSFRPFTDSVFLVPKWAVFKLLMLAALVAAATIFAFAPKMPGLRRLSPLVRGGIAASVLAMLWLVLNTFVSVDSWISWQGNLARLLGLRTVIFLLAWFWLVFWYLRQDHSRRLDRVILAATWAGALAGVYALIQSQGLDKLPWDESARWRAYSTFGQPNEFAGWLIMSITLNVIGIIRFFRQPRSEPPAWKNFFQISIVGPKPPPRKPYLSGRSIFWFLALALQIAGLFLSYSFSAWLGFFFGLALACPATYAFWQPGFSAFIRRPSGRRAMAAALLVCLALAVFVWQDRTFQARWQSFFSKDTGTGTVRLIIWPAAWEKISDRPWLGHGLETQPEVMASSYRMDWMAVIGPDALVYRAHNLFLDLLLTQGVVGLIIWLSILSGLVWLIRKQVRWGKTPEPALLVSGLLALSLFLQFQYWHLVLSIYALLFLAIIMSRTGTKTAPAPVPAAPGAGLLMSGRRIALLALLVLIAAAAAWEARTVVSRVQADRYFWEFRNAMARTDAPDAYARHARLHRSWPGRNYYDWSASLIWTTMIVDDPRPSAYPPVLDNFHPPAISPSAYTRRQYRVNYLIMQDFWQGTDNGPEIIAELDAMIALDPDRLEPYLIFARHHLIKAEYGQALAKLALAKDKLLSPDDHRLNPQHLSRLQDYSRYIENLEAAANKPENKP